MIVQPTPTGLPTRRLPSRSVAGLALAPVLLVLAVVAGFVGPQPQAPPPLPVPSVAPGDPADVAGPADAMPAIPSMFGDLVAQTPSEALGAGLPPSDAFAVSGYLGVDAADSACGDVDGGPFGAWCDRRGIVARSPWTSAGTGPFPPHMRVHIPVGVRLPSVIDGARADDGLDPMPMLLVGRRAVRPAACQGWGPAICEDEFVVDRVAWAGGVRMGLTPLIDDRLQGERRPNPFTTSLDLADLPLLAVLGWPEDVWRLDSEAGSVAITVTPGEPVWYLRVLDGARSPGIERKVRWMLLAERDLRVLASGRPGATAGTQGIGD